MLSATPSDRRRSPAVAFRVMGVDLCLALGTKARASITIGLRDSAPYAKQKSVISAKYNNTLRPESLTQYAAKEQIYYKSIIQ